MGQSDHQVPAPAYDLQSQPQHGQPQQMNYQDPGQYKQQYQPQQQQVPQVATQQPQFQYQQVVPLHSLGESAAPVDCPMCRKRGLTRVEYHSGQTTFGWAVLACCCVGLGCIPYLMKGLKDMYHYCPHCGVLLAMWHRSGRTTVRAHS